MIGKSYDGGTQWAASFGNPYLKTIVPEEGVPDVFRLLFGSGTPDWRGPTVLNNVYYGQSVVFYLENRQPSNTIAVTACPEYGTANAAAVDSAQTGTVDPLGYWAAREYTQQVLDNYRGSIFLVQGARRLECQSRAAVSADDAARAARRLREGADRAVAARLSR